MRLRSFTKLVGFVLLCQAFSLHAQKSVINIRLATPSDFNSPKNHYMHALLRASLEKENIDVEFSYSTIPMNSKRIIEELSHKDSISLAWLSMPKGAHSNLIRTTLPLYKGLHGKRLLMINQSQQHRFANINSLEELKPLVALQKQTWSDYDVLIRNGLTVNGEHDYDVMLKLLATGLADYFPRSVSAIATETAKQPYKQLIIEPTIMLQYNNYYHFYAHKKDQLLITKLQNGLLKLQQSGEFDALYQRYINRSYDALNLSSRKVFDLK
ncbi:substrate-binding periplasmic protein [Pseudoalteromonas atlantica]|uniref:substrate-binding periplasmic protein n=1 Tax=Pseudoalteromonas atlantica TaxID=288 RepID=UPI0037366950